MDYVVTGDRGGREDESKRGSRGGRRGVREGEGLQKGEEVSGGEVAQAKAATFAVNILRDECEISQQFADTPHTHTHKYVYRHAHYAGYWPCGACGRGICCLLLL